MKVIDNEFTDKDYVKEHPCGIYAIDFAWVEKLIAIEIDGKQHEQPEYKARDQRKDAYLKSLGWKVLRIAWKDMHRDPKRWIAIAKEFVECVAPHSLDRLP